MEVEIKVGALPTDTVKGFLRKIWLKGPEKDNATMFPIEILIPGAKNSVLRAGYSAKRKYHHSKKEQCLDDSGARDHVPKRFCIGEDPLWSEQGPGKTDQRPD